VRNDEQHPGADRLEAFAQSELSDGDRAVVESHLVHCTPCQTEVEEWRSLFATLASLPAYLPAAGFGDRVMKHVRVPMPWNERVGVWADQAGSLIRQGAAEVEKLLPRTTRGWAIASAFLALPALLIGGLLFWLLSKSYVTTYSLWVFTTDRFGTAAAGGSERLFSWLLSTELAAMTVTALGSLVEAGGVGALGALALAIGVGMIASMWILYTNLFRTPSRESNYVSHGI
jgi:hypothetical protein